MRAASTTSRRRPPRKTRAAGPPRSDRPSPADQRPREIELKLELVHGELSSLKRTAELAGVRLERTRVEDVYFDTDEHRLRRRALVLRLRRSGRRWLQTLKAPAAASVVADRGEWEVEVPAGVRAPLLDLERFEVTPLRMLLRAGLDTDHLRPVFGTRFMREHATLAVGASRIEIALDRGKLSVERDGAAVHCPIREVELELKSGRERDVLEFALALIDSRKALRLVPAARSKAERGYLLASDAPPQAVSASARGFAANLAPTMRTGDALRAVIRHGLGVLVANADGLRRQPSSELIHQSRVALRRMRSAIRLFDRDGSDMPAPLVRRLRRLARELGSARDWDVIANETLPSLLGAEPGQSKRHQRLCRAAKRQRRRRLDEAIAAVSSRRYARLVLRTALWTLTPSPRSGLALHQCAAPLLEGAADELFAAARGLSQLAPPARHRVRILAKRLRYALDLLSVALPGPRTDAYIEALASLQDELGALNDAVVAIEAMTGIVQRKSDDAYLRSRWSRSHDEAVAAAAARIGALNSTPRPWITARSSAAAHRIAGS